MGRPTTYNQDVLLHEIIDCLWDGGYSATPVSTLVERTGVKAASLYARFGSKKGIMLAALEMYGRENMKALETILSSVPRGTAQVRSVLEHAMQCFADSKSKGCFLVNSITAISPDMPELGQALAAYMEEVRKRLQKEFEQTPGLKTSPADAALFVQMQVWAIKLLARISPDRSMGESIIERTLQALFGDESCRAGQVQG